MRPHRDGRSSSRSSRLRVDDVWRLGVLGLRGRPARTALSSAGVALGVATMVAVLGISNSSRSQLVAEIDALGTNLLTVAPGQSFSGQTVTLPRQSPAMVRRVGPVLAASAIGDVGADVGVYRNDRISPANTNGIAVYAAQPGLLATLQGDMAAGRFLNEATVHFPAVVLGASTADALGIDRADGSDQVWLGGRWFSVAGILRPLPLAPELDRSALVGFPIAERFLGANGSPVAIYVRTDPTSVAAVQSVLAATTNPAAPQDVSITNPSDALVARADASAAFQSLFLALGAVALVVGGVGIANVMVIAILERRGEIGLRRALGARRVHVAVQFVAESTLLAAAGGVTGAVVGGFATAVYAAVRHWSAVVPVSALGAAVGASLLVGALAGLYPARRAAGLAPSDALRTV
ncbi:MAG TPA: ABC transporter permease [Acidimicrobiales bacterium]|nr:ABC transporter permease [Acidimicrobiales bacterium]